MKTTLELLSRNLVRSSLLDGSNVLVVILIAALRDLRIGASFLVRSHDEDGTTRCSRCGGLWGNLEKKCDQICAPMGAGNFLDLSKKSGGKSKDDYRTDQIDRNRCLFVFE